MNHRIVEYAKEHPRSFKETILAADVGGTNTNFGLFGVGQNGLVFLISIHYKSKETETFVSVIKHLLALLANQYGAHPHKICIAAAGVVSEKRDKVKPTNLPFTIFTADILAVTSLSCVYLLNDFEVIGHGISFIDKKDVVLVKEGVGRVRANRAILGAGTGLGKCILGWSDKYKRYIPYPSEGGHADAAFYNEHEYALQQWILKTEQRTCAVSWEDLLSGAGIRRIYSYFRSLDGSTDISNEPHPDEIFANRDRDHACHQTYEMYTTIYARCAKNFVLDALALNGIYIAGGIAAHNKELFTDPLFLQQFLMCGKQQALLDAVPIYVITDYNVSLYGAAYYMLLEGLCG